MGDWVQVDAAGIVMPIQVRLRLHPVPLTVYDDIRIKTEAADRIDALEDALRRIVNARGNDAQIIVVMRIAREALGDSS